MSFCPPWPPRAAALTLAAVCLAGCSLPHRITPDERIAAAEAAPPAASAPAANAVAAAAPAPTPAPAEPAAPAAEPAPLPAAPPAAVAAAQPAAAASMEPAAPTPAAAEPAAPAAAAAPLPNLPSLAAADGQNPLPAIAADAAEGMSGDVASAEADAQALEPARTELEKAQVRTGLSAEQMQQLHDAQARLTDGHATVALILLQGLNAELEAETRSYAVQPGDSLPGIAARREVYANPQLWPLVGAANLGTLRKTGRLHAGQVLVVPAHPTIEEVTNALEYARSHSPQTRAARSK